MAPSDCGCFLDPHYAIFNNTNSIRTLKETREKLKRKKGRKGVNGHNGVNEFLSTLEPFPAGYRTSDGIAGDKLLQLDNQSHQDGLVKMAHNYLCVSKHGSRHWSNNNGALEYPRDQDEIYYNILCHFIRKNVIKSKSRLRSKRARDEEATHEPRQRKRRRRLRSENSTTSPSFSLGPSPTPTPTPPLHDDAYNGSDDEIETPAPALQGSHAVEIAAQDGTVQEVRQMPARARESPDELAQDYHEQRPVLQPNLQQRHVNRIGDEHGNLSRIGLGQTPTPRGPRTNPHERTISTGTQTTFGVDQQRRQRDSDAPPPSSLDTNNSSQQTRNPVQDNHGDRTNGAEDPASQGSVESIPRSFSHPFVHPRMTIPEPQFNIDFLVSYDVTPGHNVPFRTNGDIFTYSLPKFLNQANWQNKPGVLLICLQAPGTSPAKPVLTWMEWVFKNDADKFQRVLRRFKQVVLGLHSDFALVKMDAVIEIAFERVVEGHTHSVLFDAWCNAGKSGTKL